MKKAEIRAMALNEDIPWKEAAMALESSKTHLIFASPEYLLRNPNMKEFYVNEVSALASLVFSLMKHTSKSLQRGTSQHHSYRTSKSPGFPTPNTSSKLPLPTLH